MPLFLTSAAGGGQRAAGDRARRCRSTTELAPVAWIRPPVLLKVPPVRCERAAAGGLERPVLVTVLGRGDLQRLPPLWLASIVPLLVSVKAKPALLIPIWPEPWIVLLVSLISVSDPRAEDAVVGAVGHRQRAAAGQGRPCR